MCNPGLLMIGATAVQAAGQAYSGFHAAAMANRSAKVAGYNKELEREAADDAIARGQEEQRRLGREIAQRVGSQTARMAANNIDITTGSAGRVTEDTKMIGREDQATLSENVRREVKGHQINVWNYEQERQAQKASATSAKIGTVFSVATTALGGAQQYAKFKTRQKYPTAGAS